MKKYIITLILITITISIFFIFNYSFTNQQNEITPVKEVLLNDNKYFIEKGLEDISKVVKPAVENYLYQDVTEAIDSRNQRLSIYFSSDSPIYKNKQNNINSLINKSTAKIISITSLETESTNPCVKVIVKTTFYQGDKVNSKMQIYWVELVKIYDKSLIPNNIGELKL